MTNLVKAQELLKGMPEAELRKYANGFAPQLIPPWLATGELNAQVERAKKLAMMQGAATGEQPSVKEQIEQKAGLMALQAQQAQAVQAQQAQPPSSPMPAPAGVPQPQAQPQEQPTMTAASGGLARSPVHFNFDGGGIVAFAVGGATNSLERAQQRAEKAVAKLQSYGLRQRQQDPKGYEAAVAEAQSAKEAVRAAENAITGGAAGAMGRSMGAGPVRPSEALNAEREKNMAEVNAAPVVPQTEEQQVLGPRTGAAPAVTQRPPAPPRPPGIPGALPQAAAPAAPAAPAGPAEGSAEQMALDALKEKRTAMSPEDAMAQEQKFAANYGLDKPQDAEQRGLLAALNKRHAAYMAERPQEELGAVLRGFGQGYGGASAAGANASRDTYTTDVANQRANLNSIDELNKRQQELQKSRYTSSGSLYGEDKKAADAFTKERMQSLAQLAGSEKTERGHKYAADTQAASSKYTADMHFRAAQAQLANANARQDMAEKRLVLDSFKTRIASIDKELAPLLKMPLGANKDTIAALQAEKAGLTKALDAQSGIATMMPAPGAERPGGTKLKYNPATGKIE